MATPPSEDAEPSAARAQLLLGENATLLSSRSMIQSELLTRITIFLTLVSAGLLSIALLGNATRFEAPFAALAIAILAFETVVGILTQLRVVNAAMDDFVLVLGMNRIRAGLAQLDPGLEQYLVTSARDDQEGINATYYPAGRKPAPSHVAASSMSLIVIVNGALIGALVAAVCIASAVPLPVAIGVGAGGGLAYVLVGVTAGYRTYAAFLRGYTARFPGN